MPDSWEKLFNTDECPLNYESIDSNDDGIRDNSEDYDNDGYSNYQEYTDGYNPCIADAPPKEEVDTIITPGKSSGDNLLPTILLILGLLLFLGGTGYLIYYYKFSSPKYSPKRVLPAFEMPRMPAASEIVSGWGKKLLDLRKRRQERLRERSKEELFGKFGKGSEDIPHIGSLLNKKEADESHIKKVAQRYVEHKEDIKPGLKASEKNIFDKLEEIAKKSRNKDIKEVISKDEASNIFDRLKEISKRRKK